MGEMYIARCLNCGYKTGTLNFGGGMMNFKTFDGEPVYNFDTNEIEIANGKKREQIQRENPNIGFYFHNEKLFKEHQDYSIDYGGDIGVQKFKNIKLYLCPKCNKFKVEFLWQGMWD